MRLVLVTWGSRGDVEPMAALALELRARGAEVRLCAPPDFAGQLAELGIPHTAVGLPVRPKAFAAARQTATKPRSQVFLELTADAFDLVSGVVSGAGAGVGAIVTSGVVPVAAAARAVAEQQAIRYANAVATPIYLPSPQHPPLPFPGQLIGDEVTDNRTLWELNAKHVQMMFGEPINRHRESIGLPPVTAVRDYVHAEHPMLAADPILGPWPLPADLEVLQTGAWMRTDGRPLPAEVEDFLDAGDPPVYVGFGSMPLRTAEETGLASIEAVRTLDRRVLLASGWAGLAAVDDAGDCLVVGEINQQALFPRVAATVHHGGAGTTHTAARAGVPQVIVPQVADQPYWGGRVTDLGIGTRHDGPTPTAESLAAALEIALAPATARRAAEVAGLIRVDGAAVAADILLQP